MPSIDIHINLFLLPFIAVIFALIGFFLRNAQIAALKKKVHILENEMLQNHAEILNLEREVSRLNSANLNSKTPVVSIKETNADDKSSSTKKHM